MPRQCVHLTHKGQCTSTAEYMVILGLFPVTDYTDGEMLGDYRMCPRHTIMWRETSKRYYYSYRMAAAWGQPTAAV